MAGGDTSARKLQLAERRRMVFELRKAGLSYRDIAEAIRDQLPATTRYGKSSAHRDVKAVLDEVLSQTRETALEVFLLDLERLDDVTRVLWDQVLEGDLGAIDRFLAVVQQRDKLFGFSKTAFVNLILSGTQLEELGVTDYAHLSDGELRAILKS